MSELRDIPLPEHYFKYPEMAEIDRVNEVFHKQLLEDIEGIHDDIMIMTATEAGIARREKILKITPADTDSLEARRARVLMMWYERSPYTRKVIERKIATLCGEGNYYFTYDAENMTLTVEMSGVEWDVINMVHEALDKMVRLMIILDVKKIFFSSATSRFHVGIKHIGTFEIAVPIKAEEDEGGDD